MKDRHALLFLPPPSVSHAVCPPSEIHSALRPTLLRLFSVKRKKFSPAPFICLSCASVALIEGVWCLVSCLRRPVGVQVMALQLEEVRLRLAEKRIDLTMTEKAIDHVVQEAFDPSFGARPLKRYLERHIVSELSIKLLKGSLFSIPRDSQLLPFLSFLSFSRSLSLALLGVAIPLQHVLVSSGHSTSQQGRPRSALA